MSTRSERRRGAGRRGAVVVAVLCAVAATAPTPISAEPPPEPPPSSHERMVRVLAEIAETSLEENRFLTPKRLRRLRRAAETLTPGGPPEERLRLYLALGMEELRFGTAERAIEHLGAAYRMFPEPEDAARQEAKVQLAYHLGLAYLRWGERLNCVASHSGESCILPIRGGGVHADRRGSEQALRYFREVLRGVPETSSVHLATRWLIHLAHQTLATEPAEVPAAERLPRDPYAPEADFPRLENVAPSVGLDTVSHAGGAVVDDFDGDGDFDVLTSSWHPEGPLRYFENRDGGVFEERTEEANLGGLFGGLNMVHADYDNDGDPDVLVLRGAWLSEYGRHPNSLLRNDGGRFTDVTFDVGLGDVHYPTQTAAWADYDGDGDLDLYVGNEHRGPVVAPSQLFRNDGDRFTDVAAEAGVENLRFAKGVAWGDYDGDRDPDLYVSNLGAPNRLYRNDGGKFVDVAGELGVDMPSQSFPVWFWDYDNDGALDLYVTSYPGAPGPERLFLSIADDLGIEGQGEAARLYRGDGEGGFRDVTAEVGLDRVSMPMGANFGDLDGDGFLDVYLGTGYPSWDGLVPSELYWNRGGERFDDVSTAAGMAHVQKGHGVAFADLDSDGDQDVFAQMGGFFPEDTFADALYENPGFGHRWLRVELVGTRSNRGGVGARLRVDVAVGQGDEEEVRSIHRWIGSGGSFGADPMAEHVGLGKAERIEALEVFWPTSGLTQSFREVPLDAAVRVVEGEEGLEVVELSPDPFAEGAPEAGHRHGGH